MEEDRSIVKPLVCIFCTRFELRDKPLRQSFEPYFGVYRFVLRNMLFNERIDIGERKVQSLSHSSSMVCCRVGR